MDIGALDQHKMEDRRGEGGSQHKVVGAGIGIGSLEDIGAGRTTDEVRFCDSRFEGRVDGNCLDLCCSRRVMKVEVEQSEADCARLHDVSW